MKKIISLIVVLLMVSFTALVQAETSKSWNGKQAAVVFTYDDSLNVHLDKVIPALNKHDFLATFYLTIDRPAFTTRMSDWATAAKHGHELGNHALFHPCDGSQAGRDWVQPEYDLSTYTVKRMHDELRLTNSILSSVDGLSERTYAYTCGDTKAGKDSFIDAIRPEFAAARGVQSKVEHKNTVDIFNIGAYFVNGHSGKDLIAIVDKAIEQNGLVVFLFHGVGGEHSLNISTEVHQELIDYVAKKRDKIWVSTMLDVANYMK